MTTDTSPAPARTSAPSATASTLPATTDPDSMAALIEQVLVTTDGAPAAEDPTSPMLPMLLPVSVPPDRGLGLGLFIGHEEGAGTTGGTGAVDDIEFPLIIPVIPEDPGEELDPVRRMGELRPRVRIRLGTYALAMLIVPAAVGLVMWVAQRG